MATTTVASKGSIEQYLGSKAEYLLGFKSAKISKERLHLPGPDFLDRVWLASDRNNRVIAIQLPRKTPYRSTASIAYSEQVGTNRQLGGSHGDTTRL